MNSASGKMNYPLDGFYTLSGWAYIDPGSAVVDRVILAKHDNQYALKISTNNSWQFFEYDGTWQTVAIVYETARWTHLVGVMNGRDTYFYLDGVEGGSILDCCSGGGSRNETANVFIGRAGESARRWWWGNLDEIRSASVPRSPDWVKLEFENQKAGQSLVWLTQPPVGIAGSSAARAATFGFTAKPHGDGMAFQIQGAEAGKAQVTLVDMWGRTVWNHTATTAAGMNQVIWSGQARSGNLVSSGVYVVRVSLLDPENKVTATSERRVPLTR
jgi:hypothetical protein